MNFLSLKYKASLLADNNLKLILYFSEKLRLDISCELSARQTIHMKCQFLFSLKKKFKVSSAVVVINALRDKNFQALLW